MFQSHACFMLDEEFQPFPYWVLHVFNAEVCSQGDQGRADGGLTKKTEDGKLLTRRGVGTASTLVRGQC